MGSNVLAPDARRSSSDRRSIMRLWNKQANMFPFTKAAGYPNIVFVSTSGNPSRARPNEATRDCGGFVNFGICRFFRIIELPPASLRHLIPLLDGFSRGDDHLSLDFVLDHVPESLASLTQRVAAVDDRRDLPAFEELPEDGHRLLLGGHRNARTSQLLHEP